MGYVKEVMFPRSHSTDFNPLGLYQFQIGALTTDSSGNSETLTESVAGTSVNGTSTNLMAITGGYYTRTSSSFRLIGDMSVVALVHYVNRNTQQWIVGYGGTAANSTGNVAWSLGISSSNTLRYYHEVDTNSAVVASFSETMIIPFAQWSHLAITRTSSGTVKGYINGSEINATVNMTNIDSSNAANAIYINRDPDSANSNTNPTYSIAVYNTVLTEQQIKYLAKKTLRRIV